MKPIHQLFHRQLALRRIPKSFRGSVIQLNPANFIPFTPNWHSGKFRILLILTKSRQKTEPQDRIEPISVASEQGLNASAYASIQTAATKVTDIGSILSWGSSIIDYLFANYRVTFSRCHISFAYSSIVRSEENLPADAVWSIAVLAQCSSSR